MPEWLARLLKSPVPALLDLLSNVWWALGLLLAGLIWAASRLGLWKRCSKRHLESWFFQLEHSDGLLRSEAQGLISCGNLAVLFLVDVLKKTDSDKRRKLAAEVLCEIGVPALRPLLAARKGKEGEEEKKHVASCVDDALEKYLPEVVQRRQCEYEREHASAWKWKWKQFWTRLVHSERTERIVDRLIALLDDDDPIVQEGAALALGQYRRSEVVRVLGQKLDGCRNSEVREMVAQSLGQIKRSDAVPYLSIGLMDRSRDARLAVCQALHQINYWKAIFALGGTLLLDENREVQVAAAKALGHTGDKEAMRVLEKALEILPDDDDHRGLRQIVGEESAQLSLKLSGRETI